MKRIASLAGAGLLALAAAVLPAAPSAATGSCGAVHCYGIAHYPAASNFDGVGQELWTDCLSLDTPLSGDIATHEMWVWTNAPHTSEMGPFIETGYVRGFIAGGDTDSWFRWFWGEWTGTAYYSHKIANAPILNWINFSVYKQANSTWKVYANGVERGTSVQQATAGTYIQTGGETTDPQVYSHGKSRYLQWHDISSGAWTWGHGAIPAATSGVYQVTTNAWERMEQISLQKICNPLPGGSPGPFKAPAVQDVKALAVEVAKVNGEKSPQALDVVTSKRKAAQGQLKGGVVDSDEDVYVVQMRGQFVGNMASVPKGTQAPKGTVMTLTIDKATGELTDWSLSSKTTDLGKLGAVKPL